MLKNFAPRSGAQGDTVNTSILRWYVLANIAASLKRSLSVSTLFTNLYRSVIVSEVGGRALETQKSKANLYRSVKITGLANRRRGKHHDLVGGIFER